MDFVAQELREYMAALGIRTVDELVGRSDLLRVREKLVTHRAETLDLRSLLENPWAAGRPTSIPEMFTTFIWSGPWMSVLLAKLGKTLKGEADRPVGAHRLLHGPGLRHAVRRRDHPAVRGLPCRMTVMSSPAMAAEASPSAPSSPRD